MAKTKEPKSTRVGLLEIRLGASLTTTTRRLAESLHETAALCRRVRNYYVWHWLRWREDNPDWRPEKAELLPPEEQKRLYRECCALAPNVAVQVVNSCINREMKALSANVPYDHPGQARKRWQALLWHEVNPQTSRAETVPLHNQIIRLCYAGDMDGPARGPVGGRLAEFGESEAVLAFQLYSRNSGRESNAFCRIETRQFPEGKRMILRRLARGEWKVRDSLLVFKEKQERWFFQLTYEQPSRSLGLDAGRVAFLASAAKEADQPFVITLGENAPFWNLGFRVLEREYTRIEDHRLALRRKYKVAGSGRRGHGRDRIEYRIRKVTHQAHDLMERFTDHVIADALKFCVRHDCGTIDYAEPALAVRARTWFAARSIPYDWTTLLSKLKQKCVYAGIRLLVNGVEEIKAA